ncbi:hypothetical protein [Candidatus Laterigemmans baculatus]|uniref:hypothetical protein n=1 Tax=Candidatus Laterigemmans baculatus TaxID=2770505 RepID=UPI00193C6BE9|nr:hypothetical protein [Candidatus Laterigemmans baculatus]
MSASYSPGDWVIYRKSKRSAAPGPRAQDVMAAQKGEKYSYVVEKFWIVDAVLPGNQLRLRTRRGKIHQLSSDDPNLRPAGWLKRFLYRNRFREIPTSPEVATPPADATNAARRA